MRVIEVSLNEPNPKRASWRERSRCYGDRDVYSLLTCSESKLTWLVGPNNNSGCMQRDAILSFDWELTDQHHGRLFCGPAPGTEPICWSARTWFGPNLDSMEHTSEIVWADGISGLEPRKRGTTRHCHNMKESLFFFFFFFFKKKKLHLFSHRFENRRSLLRRP